MKYELPSYYYRLFVLPIFINFYISQGDNQMLPQQVVKVLLKLVQAVQMKNTKVLAEYKKSCDAGQLIPSLQSILGGRRVKCAAASKEDLLVLPTLLQALCHRAARLLLGAANLIQIKMGEGRTAEQAWNDGLVEMARTSRAYSQFLLLQNFIRGIEDEEQQSTVGPSEIAVLEDMARLSALFWMEKDLGDFLEDGYLTARQAGWVRANVLTMLDVIRPNAVALVDSWDYSDFCLRSALGRWDGDVYPALLETCRRDPLNAKGIGPGYQEHLKRLTVDGVGDYKTPTTSRL